MAEANKARAANALARKSRGHAAVQLCYSAPATKLAATGDATVAVHLPLRKN